MTQKEKFMISEGLLLLAYAYAVSGYHTASAGFGVLALMSAVLFHSVGSLKGGMILIPVLSLAQIGLIRFLNLDAALPTLGFLSFCNTAYAWLWMKSSYKAVDDVIRMITGIYLMILVFLLVIPEGMADLFTPGAKGSLLKECLTVSLIFLPCIIGYTAKCLRDFRFIVHVRNLNKPMEQEVHLR